ncbi:MAG TPA: hydrogenase [Candidatus Omnitrophota bacterium]|nr:hydrogenase [Candidatus Omnitrophota bacterium]HPT39600.1 hydrogenase [Candidatus Omnitrophota bacterium]
MQFTILFAVLISTYLMVIAKRMPALIRAFRYQSFCLFLATFLMAIKQSEPDLYAVAALLFILKVIFIPQLLYRTVKKIKAKEDLGLFINPQLSLLWALGFTYLSWEFSTNFISQGNEVKAVMLTIAFFVVLAGIFLMVSRMTALAQIIGLLAMENGIFLLAAAVTGGMPFFVEIAIFFDVLVSVLIMGFFVYRINKFFTHIDVNKLSRLRG